MSTRVERMCMKVNMFVSIIFFETAAANLVKCPGLLLSPIIILDLMMILLSNNDPYVQAWALPSRCTLAISDRSFLSLEAASLSSASLAQVASSCCCCRRRLFSCDCRAVTVAYLEFFSWKEKIIIVWNRQILTKNYNEQNKSILIHQETQKKICGLRASDTVH